ncbi:MAG: hypothetical protein AAF555_11635 [Verrucomicrobiota bacterium]
MPDTIMKTMSLYISLGCIVVGSQLQAEEPHFRTASVKLTSEIAKGSIRGETAIQMAAAGIDFPVLLQRAIEGDRAAVKLLFWSSANIGLDGGAADGFGSYLLDVAEKIGDAKLSQILSSIKDPETLETIRFFLLDESGFSIPEEGSSEKAITAVSELLPKTWVHLNSIGEQDVAPQSATRTESKSEGDDKLQPESEERSR